MYLPKELVLVRHGQSEANVVSRAARCGDYAGLTMEYCIRSVDSYHLTENGKQQAEKAGAWLREQNEVVFDVVATSTYCRAVETLHAMGSDFAKQSNGAFNLVRERGYGNYDHSLPEDRIERYRDPGLSRDEDPFHWTPPGGESIAHVVERARLFLCYLPMLNKNFDRVLVVSHGEMMWAFRVLLEQISPIEFKRLHHSKDPGDRIYNCHVLHYKRQSHETIFSQLRSVCTYDPSRYDSDWTTINQPLVDA